MSLTFAKWTRRKTVPGTAAIVALLAASQGALALDNPHGLALDATGKLYVANSGNSETGQTGDIEVFSVRLTKTGISAKQTAAITTNILYPYSVAVSPSGNIYAGNLGNNTITVYDPAGSQIGTISDGSITTYAVDMYADGDGDLFALDAGGKVHVYLDNLTAVSTFSVGGIATAITPWGGNVAIWGRNATGISTLTANMGEAVHGTAGFNGNYPNGSVVPTGVAEDSIHQQYVTNATAGQITVYSASFNAVVTTFSAFGSAIAIDSVNNRIYTAAPSSSTIFVYSLKPPYKFLGSF
jgi:hypothetical protein